MAQAQRRLHSHRYLYGSLVKPLNFARSLLVAALSAAALAAQAANPILVLNSLDANISVIDQQIEEQKKRLELAKLQAETNRTISEGITPQLLQQQFIEKWDGKTPLYGDTPVTIFKQQ